MGPIYRGGQIQNKSLYSQPVFLAAILRVSYSLSLICLMTSEDIKHKIISRPAWRMEPLAGCSQTGLHLSTGSLPVVGGTTGYVQRFPAARVNPGGGGRGERLRVSSTQL